MYTPANVGFAKIRSAQSSRVDAYLPFHSSLSLDSVALWQALQKNNSEAPSCFGKLLVARASITRPPRLTGKKWFDVVMLQAAHMPVCSRFFFLEAGPPPSNPDSPTSASSACGVAGAAGVAGATGATTEGSVTAARFFLLVFEDPATPAAPPPQLWIRPAAPDPSGRSSRWHNARRHRVTVGCPPPRPCPGHRCRHGCLLLLGRRFRGRWDRWGRWSRKLEVQQVTGVPVSVSGAPVPVPMPRVPVSRVPVPPGAHGGHGRWGDRGRLRGRSH